MAASITGCCGRRPIKPASNGPIEVEIFNASSGIPDPDQVLEQMIERFTAFV